MKRKKVKFNFGDKVTDICDTPERNYIVIKRTRGKDYITFDRKGNFYKIHEGRLKMGWNRKIGDGKP